MFLTPLGDSQGLYVTNRTPTSFEVREQNGGKSNISFGYRIVAKSAGSDTARMPIVTIPETVTVPRESSKPTQPQVPAQVTVPAEPVEAPQPTQPVQPGQIPQEAQP